MTGPSMPTRRVHRGVGSVQRVDGRMKSMNSKMVSVKGNLPLLLPPVSSQFWTKYNIGPETRPSHFTSWLRPYGCIK